MNASGKNSQPANRPSNHSGEKGHHKMTKTAQSADRPSQNRDKNVKKWLGRMTERSIFLA